MSTGIDGGCLFNNAIRLCVTQGRICVLVMRRSEIVHIFLELARREIQALWPGISLSRITYAATAKLRPKVRP